MRFDLGKFAEHCIYVIIKRPYYPADTVLNWDPDEFIYTGDLFWFNQEV